MQISFYNVTLMLRECYQLDIILICINRLLLYCLSVNKTMDWEKLLSLKRFGDTQKRERKDQDETRLGFEVDYDRIIFSSDFRSLQDKTQVVPLSSEDFVHTRLTHSLEVSVVGRSLGRKVGMKVLENILLKFGVKLNLNFLPHHPDQLQHL